MSNDELSDFMRLAPDKVAPRTSAVWCGDCGSWPSEEPNKCPKCGGPADSLLSVDGLRKLATARLTKLFDLRDEVMVTIDRGQQERPEREYLEDCAGDFYEWPSNQQAAFYVAVAFGGEYERVCKRCDGLKPDCVCDEK